MIKLSAVIITYNEEFNIRRCIESIIDIVDEIVIVDSFSSDRTKEICMEFDLNFIEKEFLGYIQQKNYALKRAKYDYILSLDGDEALSYKLQNSITKMLQIQVALGTLLESSFFEFSGILVPT